MQSKNHIFQQKHSTIIEKNSSLSNCTQLTNQKVVEREYRSLEIVKDSFPKYVLSLDKGFETSRSGIKWMNIIEFLLDNSW